MTAVGMATSANFFTRRRRLRARFRLRQEPQTQTPASRLTVSLERLSAGMVPAHGVVFAAKGSLMKGLGGKLFQWIKKLASAVSVAGMIALGLFVYTEFTAAWQKRGLPTIPITALSHPPPGAQNTIVDHQRRDAIPSHREERTQPRHTLSLLDDYVG